MAKAYTSYMPKDGSTQSAAFTGTAGTISSGVGTGGSGEVTIRVFCTADAFIKLGASPTATSSDIPVAASSYEYFDVPAGTKVSAVQQSASGTLYVTEMVS